MNGALHNDRSSLRSFKRTLLNEAARSTSGCSIAIRSIWTLTKSQNANDLYRIWREARDAGAEFHLAAVPVTFSEKPKQAFDPEYQKKLFDEGFRIGRTGSGWQRTPPVRVTGR